MLQSPGDPFESSDATDTEPEKPSLRPPLPKDLLPDGGALNTLLNDGVGKGMLHGSAQDNFVIPSAAGVKGFSCLSVLVTREEVWEVYVGVAGIQLSTFLPFSKYLFLVNPLLPGL